MDFFNLLQPQYWMIVVPTMLLALGAQIWVKSAFSHWSKVLASRGLTGREVAERVLAYGGVSGVQIEQSQGFLTDHYDPAHRVLRLSPQNYSGRTVAAAAIAAHEAGHAIQHARHYAPLALRAAAVPMAGLGSNLGLILIMIGLFLNVMNLAIVGVFLFAGVVAFQLITLPVEFNASSRAKAVLAESGIITSPEEERGVNAVLNAAAMTYVAAAVTALAHLLYYLLLVLGSRDRR